jgi:cytochrome P450
MEHDGLLRYFWLFNTERVVVLSPKAIGELLVTNSYSFEKPKSMVGPLARVTGYGVLLAEGDEHKVQRRNLMPAFAFRHIKDLYPLFWSKTREVVQAMTASGGDNKDEIQIDVGDWASRCTLDIIGVAGLGYEFKATQGMDGKIAQQYRTVFNPSASSRALLFLGIFLPRWVVENLPLERNREFKAATTGIRQMCKDLIRDKKAKLANKELQDVDILSVALESGQFSDENLVDQLMTFLAAGHETTATAMTWALYLLSRHQDVQTKLREEVRANLPSMDSDKGVSSIDIDRLPYLNAVCSEVLRYYSPVPTTVRQAVHDTTLLGQKIPKGTVVFLNPWVTNKDPALWGEDAAEFKPERWLNVVSSSEGGQEKTTANNNGGAESNYAFLTFLHGPRSCIGASFARAEFACLLAGWVGRFAFELRDKELMDEDKLTVKTGVVARPGGGMHVVGKVVPGF